MEIFLDGLMFWLAAAVIYCFYQAGQEVYKDLRTKYILWAWKRRR
jgi:hypothetical protein